MSETKTTEQRDEGARRGIDRLEKRYRDHSKLTPEQARNRAREVARRNESQ